MIENAPKKIVIYPNIDVGNKTIISEFKKFKKLSDFQFYENFKRTEFIYLLKKASVLVGNSSCGILEASSFKLPVINIGSRQRGRLQPNNVVNTSNLSIQIQKKIRFVLNNKKFKDKIRKCKNPYGDGKSSDRIVNILKNIRIDNKLLDKINTY